MFSKRHLNYIDRLGGIAAARRVRKTISSPIVSGKRPRFGRGVTREGLNNFWRDYPNELQQALCDENTIDNATSYAANIENMIGVIKLPIGLAGPVLVRGLNANGEYIIPLATTEAALVASYARGANVISKSGGAITATLSEGVLRTPAFVFDDIIAAGEFVAWVAGIENTLNDIVATQTRFGKLEHIEPTIDNNIVFLMFRYSTGDASGQNMVTIATDAICRFLVENAPITPNEWFIEGNFSGDKKASHLGMINGRGRKVSASIIIPDAIIEKYLQTTAEQMLAYSRVAALGAQLSGQLGAQGHFANGLAALFIATGQDAACVAESAVGFTRMEKRDGGLFMSVTLPNLMIGTIGGGTGLPTQRAALELMGLYGHGKAAELAEVTATLCLAGEISIMAAIAAGHFTRAHDKLARTRLKTKI